MPHQPALGVPRIRFPALLPRAVPGRACRPATLHGEGAALPPRRKEPRLGRHAPAPRSFCCIMSHSRRQPAPFWREHHEQPTVHLRDWLRQCGHQHTRAPVCPPGRDAQGEGFPVFPRRQGGQSGGGGRPSGRTGMSARPHRNRPLRRGHCAPPCAVRRQLRRPGARRNALHGQRRDSGGGGRAKRHLHCGGRQRHRNARLPAPRQAPA